MLAPACAGKEFTWHDQQYMWVKATNTADEDAIVVVRGRIVQTMELDGQRLCFVESACEEFADWPDHFDCGKSRITLFLTEGVEYDIIGWSEPGDRREPDRFTTNFKSSWTCCNE